METYRTWVRLLELQHYYSWIVDRFHLSTSAYQLQRMAEIYDFALLEDAPAALRLPPGVVHALGESFEARRERLKVSGNPSQYDDLQTFIDEQALMRRLAGDRSCPAGTGYL